MKVKFLWTLIIITIIGTSLLNARSEQHLIAVDKSDLENKAILQELDPAIYMITADAYLLGYQDLTKLDKAGLIYRIIDRNAWSDYYYMVSDKRNTGMEADTLPGEVLYSDSQLILIKSPTELTSEQITKNPYHFAQLFPKPLDYHFQTMVVGNYDLQVPRYRNTELEELLEEINADSLRFFIRKLEELETRFAYADNRAIVAEWIKNQFTRFGINDVEYDLFYLNHSDQRNVVATIPGRLNPEQMVIIGGHHDSVSGNQSFEFAPGADDNASGAGAALEIARAMMAVGYEPEATVRFITFAAEEVGLRGSFNYAAKAREEEMNIKLLINNDMIAYNTQSPDNWMVHLIRYSGFENYADFSAQVMQQYTTLTPLMERYNSPNSDSYPFWAEGYGAVFFHERNFNPYYHTDNDLLVHLDLDYAIETVKASAAIAALINTIPDTPKNMSVQDAGTGSDLIVRWEPVDTPGIEHYKVSIGLSSGNYITDYTTGDTTMVISDLETERKYYIGVSTVSTSGYSSSIVQSSAIPRLIPVSPTDFKDRPHRRSITLRWSANQEADLAGYRIYRSTEEGNLGQLLNQELQTGTYYIDEDIESGIWYYYSMSAVDETDNESEPTEQIRTRLLSFDQGVLIVADTSPGNGSFLRPTIESITDYYQTALTGYTPDIYDLWDHQTIKLADVGAYSSIVWHRNSTLVNPYETSIIAVIKSFLDMGGNLLVSSFYPSRLFDGHHSFPVEFEQGSFIYDYLKIGRSHYELMARFNGAYPSQNSTYPELHVDQDKSSAGLNYHIFQIESCEANQQGTNIYFYKTDFDEASPGASMQGLPVGVEYLGEDYKAVTLSFPLYYMQDVHSRQLISYVLGERFNEQVGIDDDLAVNRPQTNLLYPNYPNPFNPETNISFYLTESSAVSLKVYNLKGQQVFVIEDTYLPAGQHSYIWQGKDENGNQAASGIYFLRMETDRSVRQIKMLLLK